MTEGQFLKKVRAKNKLTQRQVSDLLGLETVVFYSLIENDRAKIPFNRAIQICDALKMDKKERTKLVSILTNKYKQNARLSFGV